ncbi:lysophospholipid acyltransferase family protein [Polymorphospora rubra]|uniref:lysophospholipid acyltransferase family protein n=1 Tax=Polymorphospora rubra TaxID=338584 RepID=UPI001BB36FD6|nr:lysophospholipid acyltransferase family protein [Polymorphospora rubra]
MNPLWRPSSTCGPRCLPPAGGPRVSTARLAARFGALLAVLVCGLPLPVVLPLLPRRQRDVVVRAWARAVLRAVGVRLVVRGRPPRRRALLVANHVSWLDPLVLLAVAPARMIAKREVRDWPLIGALVAAGGTILVDRERPRSLPATVAAVRSALAGDAVVAVFPEGTTWCGRETGRFRPATFQAAVDTGAPVVPVSLRYGRSTGTATTVAAFLGDDTLWASVRRVLAAPDLTVTVTARAALHPGDAATRRQLARIAEAAVRADDNWALAA